MRAVAIVALVLSSVAIAAADDEDDEDQQGQHEEQPTGHEGEQGEEDDPDVAEVFGIQATGHYGKCFSVVWNADPTRVVGYKVTRPAYPPDTPAAEWIVPPGQNNVRACDMTPGETYEYEVCVHYGNDKGDTGCDTANLTLNETGNMKPGGPLPIPVIDTPFQTSPDNFGWAGRGTTTSTSTTSTCYPTAAHGIRSSTTTTGPGVGNAWK